MRRLGIVLLVHLSATPLGAQDLSPLSAIDWLSKSVETPVTPPVAAVATPEPMNEPPASTAAGVPQVSVMSLDAPSPDPVGLLSSSITGLPQDLWAKSDTATLVNLIQTESFDTLPAVDDLMMTLLLAEADPPVGAGSDGALFLARVDKLLDLGALDPALALLEQVDTSAPDIFRRWFDVSLLTGQENVACKEMNATPNLAPTYSARIFCTARSGDWSAAALTLNTHRVLGDITEEEEALLSRFLDPDLYEDEADLPPPSRLSPLVFRMREAIGQGLPTARLPNAFAHSDLRSTTGWKSQLEAAERLARIGAVSENILQGQYLARTPAASGGVWDRARAVQTVDAAIAAGDSVKLAAVLPDTWDAMKAAKLEVPFARLYGPALANVPLTGKAANIAYTIALLSPDYETVAQTADKTDFLSTLAQGEPKGASAPLERAIQAAFNGAEPSAELEALARNGQLGEALLQSIFAFNEGFSGDLQAITETLAFWRFVGLEDIARRTALQLLTLDRPT